MSEMKENKWGRYCEEDVNTYYHLTEGGVDLYCPAGTQHWSQAAPPDGAEIREL